MRCIGALALGACATLQGQRQGRSQGGRGKGGRGKGYAQAMNQSLQYGNSGDPYAAQANQSGDYRKGDQKGGNWGVNQAWDAPAPQPGPLWWT